MWGKLFKIDTTCATVKEIHCGNTAGVAVGTK